MADREFIRDYLEQFFDELEPKEFYRAIFPEGSLETPGQQNQGKYNGIAVELLPKEENGSNARRYVITDNFEIMDKLLQSKNFIIVSPITYIGKSRQASNARFIYAIAIDLDGITELHYLHDLFHQMENDILPRPTYMVWSGTGLHLYYQLIKPVPCFDNIKRQLSDLKAALTKRIWNSYVTELYEKPQIQSLFQGFRMVGSITKGGSRTRAFVTGYPVSIEYLNKFVSEEAAATDFVYKSDLTLKEAAAKYPEWYEKRIVQKQPKGTWQCKKDLYNWWLRRLHESITEGHRYYGIMCLCIYAKKCGVSREELEKDAFDLLDFMEGLTQVEENHFTREDILAALELYNDNYITFPIDSISELTQIPIEKNKRNYRKQADHVQYMNTIREFKKKMNEPMNIGRPTKEGLIRQWQQANPEGKKADCIKETGISKKTVYKYWSDNL